jgi:hypothetical protein
MNLNEADLVASNSSEQGEFMPFFTINDNEAYQVVNNHSYLTLSGQNTMGDKGWSVEY